MNYHINTIIQSDNVTFPPFILPLLLNVTLTNGVTVGQCHLKISDLYTFNVIFHNIRGLFMYCGLLFHKFFWGRRNRLIKTLLVSPHFWHFQLPTRMFKHCIASILCLVTGKTAQMFFSQGYYRLHCIRPVFGTVIPEAAVAMIQIV